MEEQSGDPTRSGPPGRRYVSPLQVAQALGISETTVKRWVDSGKLPAQRTEGGHRRILVGDVLRYVSQKNWPHVDLAGLLGSETTVCPVETPGLGEEFYTSLIEDDPDRARSLLLTAHQSGVTIPRLADEVISPMMARLGHGWSSGELDVYQEHRGTQVCLSALLSLKAKLESEGEPPETQPLAIGGGPEFDHYLLANLLIEMTVREMGWRVTNIGPNTPFSSFRRALAELRPDVVWISCSYLADVEGFLAGYRPVYTEAVQLGAAVTVGGRALTESIRERMSFTHHGDRMAHLVAFLRSLRVERR